MEPGGTVASCYRSRPMQGEAVLHSGCASLPAARFTGVVAFVLFGTIAGLFLAWGHVVPVVTGVLVALLAAACIPWQLADAVRRRHELTGRGLRYRCGLIGRYETEVPYAAVQGVTVHQGIWQRLFGCADVRVAVAGVTGPVLVSARDYNSIVLRSIPDFEAVARILRERMSRTPQA